jgi:signal recognition particle receptor subunit beta
MPSFDFDRNCYIVRIVYDGPGLAGKTTNIERVCRLIPAKQRSEMVTPAALKGRTMFFDWLELEGPNHEDALVRFQLISVPGQEARNYRRRPLIEAADVVVFVADATGAGMNDTQRTFARLKVSMRRRLTAPPLVVQVNKQDVAGALSVPQLRKKLRLDEQVPMVRATANQGKGVKPTLTLAMRLGVELIEAADVDPLVPELANADTLFDHVLAFEDEPDNNEPIEVEELNLKLEESEHSPEAVAAHLSASSMDSLERKAQRAATDNPESTRLANDPMIVGRP